ncbi:MAG: methyltransferase type 11 [Opitutales bacterium]|jgi:ubiquinone/menaquinone biosynthesis C-methylase UbiE|nr:methyltransferase type 11 [Opitutales bacterium]|tara:strand:+ start:6868 stop:7437 length:570 start_codon:yes stop_codon:yes gene_type:complete
MKTRESGMPPEETWQTFFRPAETLEMLRLRKDMAKVVDFGCGYGTFAIPAAQITTGIVHAFDVDPSMIEETRRKAEASGCRNVNLCLRDFVADGTGLADSFADYVMIFNLLHAEHPERLLQESFRILKLGGLLAIMHWNHDPETPRGPSMDIRPKPSDCVGWMKAAGFKILVAHVDLPPYHYGILAQNE